MYLKSRFMDFAVATALSMIRLAAAAMRSSSDWEDHMMARLVTFETDVVSRKKSESRLRLRNTYV